MIRQNRNRMIIVFKIMFLLLKYYDNKQKFLIMRFMFNLSKNYFFFNKRRSNITASDLCQLRTL